jgi:hypothetical protein
LLTFISFRAQDNYGKADAEAVQRVKEVYRSLGLEAVFAEYEAQSHESLTRQIQEQALLPQAREGFVPTAAFVVVCGQAFRCPPAAGRACSPAGAWWTRQLAIADLRDVLCYAVQEVFLSLLAKIYKRSK